LVPVSDESASCRVELDPLSARLKEAASFPLREPVPTARSPFLEHCHAPTPILRFVAHFGVDGNKLLILLDYRPVEKWQRIKVLAPAFPLSRSAHSYFREQKKRVTPLGGESSPCRFSHEPQSAGPRIMTPAASPRAAPGIGDFHRDRGLSLSACLLEGD
jgi:hypothetical protein